MKRFRTLLILMVFSCLFVMGKADASAAGFTISYQRVEGASGTIAATDDSEATAFTNVINEVETVGGQHIIAFLYNECMSARTPADIGATANMTVTVVTQEDVGAGNYGDIGSEATWFIVNNKLYITGKAGRSNQLVTINDDAPVGGRQTLDMKFTGATSEVYYPSTFYSDLEGNGDSGVKASAVGDEITFSQGQFYTFTDAQAETYFETLGARDDIGTFIYTGLHASGTFGPTSVGWFSHAATITDVYISDDIKLSGNMNGLFNASPAEGSSEYKIRNSGKDDEMGESAYKALKHIYMYCNMEQVTGAAGMFARCPSLENIYVRHGQTMKMTNVKTTAYMFYGNEKLVNGTDSLIDALDLSDSVNLQMTSYMFGGCSAVSQPNVSTYKMDNVIMADGMFFGAINARLISDPSSSEKYNIYNWKMPKVVTATAMFSGGDSDGVLDADYPVGSMDPGIGELNSYGNVVSGTIDMTNWDMDACVMMYMMFSRNGSEFVGVVFDSAYPALIDASGMFLRCDYLRDVKMRSTMDSLKNTTIMFKLAGSKAAVANADIQDFTAPNLKNADFMFYGSGFRTIDTTGISGLSNLESAKGMFGNCTNLSSLGTGALSTVTFGSLKDAKMMFIDDAALVKVDSSHFNMSSVTDLSFMVQNTPNLTTGLDLANWGVTSALTNMECFAQGNGMASYDYSSWDTSKVTNFAFAFSDNPNVTSITPAGANSALYSATVMFGTFSNDPKLTTVGRLASPNNTSIAGVSDVRGLFANDTALVSVDVKDLVKTRGRDAAYFMKNCSSITALDISGWNTSGVASMQGFTDGAVKLATLTTGSTFTAASVEDAGTMLRNNYVLKNDDVNKVLTAFAASSRLTNAYEMLKNTYAVTSLDMSRMNLSNVKDMRRFAAMEANASYNTVGLTTIKLPTSILSAEGVRLKDDDNTCLNMFYVAGNETSAADDVLTTLYINGTPNSNILAYNFGGTNGDNDNRSFVKYVGRTINGKDVGSCALDNSIESAVMVINAESTFYTNGTTSTSATQTPLAYKWFKGNTALAGATDKTYTTDRSGAFVATAYPSILTGSSSAKTATFAIGATIIGIDAYYDGDSVVVGKEYSLDDVVVVLIDSDGSEIAITPDDYTVDSRKVTKVGDNIYTVTYNSGDNLYSAKITVPGIRMIGAISAIYSGPSVIVGKEYDAKYVTVFAYYVDDIDQKSGFEVKPSSLSSLKVVEAGDNTYTAKYIDENQGNKEFEAQYMVNGYKTINSIAATYTGKPILVGEKYKKKDVKVTLYYADGSGSSTTTNFTCDSYTVTYEGGNSFTADYRDPFGNIYSAGFSVPGYKKGGGGSNDNNNNDNNNNNNQPQSPEQNVVQGITSSTVYAPVAGAGYSASGVKTGTSTGVVQTGTTGKAVLYLISILVLIGAIVIGIRVRKSLKNR